MTPFTEKVIAILKKVPQGKVATYGQIAYLSGNRRAARHISRILYSMSERHQLPWHRIINAQGKIVSPNSENQIKLLMAEGVAVNENNHVDLKIHQWQPDDTFAEWMEG